ncbi:rna-directed dna polymerase from mobile element jockey-like [Pitangus sulphuratus]|nr:rna-directed dna polymerase from mobile element jockey-like [Pitangus sulphuratus]
MSIIIHNQQEGESSSQLEQEEKLLADNKLSLSQQCALEAKKANAILAYVMKNIASVKGGDLAPLLSHGDAASAVLCPLLGSSVQERHGAPGVGPAEGNKDD